MFSVGNWSGMALHLRGNTEAFMRAASPHKKLRMHSGTHVHPFYTEDGRQDQLARLRVHIEHALDGMVVAAACPAARSVGLTFGQSLRFVVMPQALRTVVGPLGGIFIALLKNSGVAVAINVPELTSAANQIGTDTAQFSSGSNP